MWVFTVPVQKSFAATSNKGEWDVELISKPAWFTRIQIFIVGSSLSLKNQNQYVVALNNPYS